LLKINGDNNNSEKNEQKNKLTKGVRFEQESLSVFEQILLSVFSKNPCPLSAGIGVRFGQELVSVLDKNMQ
jgi:hypothetical protein